ncbi:MAG: FHA domain-containing protein [Gammaproteobacteria bacterium]|nr:FHA domain-containing protein [Gammaproteobacteria bacterium]MDH3408854.1 FHA domain-containing protein [Gammaproteobacteria bacterium]MDH3553676.1 FHA domain-containing protein [Gammaproteobacteria bacterium]
MDLGAAGLSEQPFRTHGRPLSTVSYASHLEAIDVLRETYAARSGLCLLQGPLLSGKTTIIRHFIDTLPDDCAVAVIDGKGLNTTGLLEAVLRQFGYVLAHSSPTELMGLLRVFTMQQAASHQPPLLIIENTRALKASALRALCELADLDVRGTKALKIVLVSDTPLRKLVRAPALASIANRLTHDFHLRPMTNEEAMEYLHTKLRAAGSEIPEFIFPIAVCTELWRASGGWPGILDRIALLSLARADTLPVPQEQVERPVLPHGTWNDEELVELEVEVEIADQAAEMPTPPTLYVSHDGETLHETVLDMPRLLIGRSEHNDITISSKFVSRHHALLVRHGSATFLMDLNSTNGTFVNSKRVSNHVLVHNDVITVGHHRIKFNDPYATKRGSLEGVEFADTVIMKTLEDMRRLLAQENTEVLPTQTENLPTSSGS